MSHTTSQTQSSSRQQGVTTDDSFQFEDHDVSFDKSMAQQHRPVDVMSEGAVSTARSLSHQGYSIFFDDVQLKIFT